MASAMRCRVPLGLGSPLPSNKTRMAIRVATPTGVRHQIIAYSGLPIGNEPIATSAASTTSVDADLPAVAPSPVPMYTQYPPPPEAMYQMDPRYYQVPGAPAAGGRPQDYYMAPPPPGYYPYAPPPPREEASSGGAPWFIWMGVGMAACFVLLKVQEFMKNPKTPQQMMTEMMMKQAMNAMGGGKPGASPFGSAGMPPFGASGVPGGFPMPPPPAAASSFRSSAATVDVPSTPVSSTDDSRKGEKFKKNATSTAEPNQSSESRPNLDVVEPSGVKEPTSGSTSSSSSSPKPGFFTDVSLEEKAAKAAASSANTFEQQQQQQQQQGTPVDPAASENMMNMMETMLRNPEMQKMLYPYLPEPMRNPSSIEWMLSNPEVKKQMASMFEQQNMMSPQMMDMMKGMDFNQSKVNQQFDELGLKPEDVISKVMSNPELASGFSNPKVQAAIIDISQNPMNIVKYQNDPEIMKVLEKVTEVFQPNIPPANRT